MKKASNIDDLASRLSQAATTPLVAPAAVTPPTVSPDRAPSTKTQKRGSVSVFLRLPADLHAKLDEEATARTRATGRGVTVQQVILDRLAGLL